MSRTPTKNIDYTSRDYEAFRALLIQKLQEKMPEYTDTSENDAGIVIIEALANGLDILSLYLDVMANDLLLPTTQDRSIANVIAQCLGYTPYNQTASKYKQVFVLSALRDTDTLIPKGTRVKTLASTSLAEMYYETLEDLVIPAGYMGNEKDSSDNYVYTVTVESGTSITQDVIGSSTGAPLQSFSLNYRNVLMDSLKVYVNEGLGAEEWARVDSFFNTDQNSKVFIASIDEYDVCTIQFGNGIRGKIPTAFVNGIVANYKIGGGEASNVNENTITAMDSNIPFVAETFNLEATQLAHDKESLDSIKVNAPASFRSKDRLVTLQDYADLLRINFYAFLDVVAVRDETTKTLAHIYYKLRNGYTMTAELVAEIGNFISGKSMIGTTYDLNAYTPQTTNFAATLYVDSDYDKDQISTDVETYLRDVIFADGEILFGDSIVKSDVESEIKNMFEGILSFRITSPNTDIISPSSENKILEIGTVTITSQYL